MVSAGETFCAPCFVCLIKLCCNKELFSIWLLSSHSSTLSTQTDPGQDGFAVPCYFLLWPIKTKLSQLVDIVKSFWLVQSSLTYLLCVVSSHWSDNAIFLKFYILPWKALVLNGESFWHLLSKLWNNVSALFHISKQTLYQLHNIIVISYLAISITRQTRRIFGWLFVVSVLCGGAVSVLSLSR